MRLWHIKLIPVLPREQLVAQWRELSAIAGAIKKKGTPNHILVNFILNYNYDHFISYAAAVRSEMTSRGYRTMDSVWNKITSLKPNWNQLPHNEIYKEKMNDNYMIVCYWNLWEKFNCGGISGVDFEKIEKVYNTLIREKP
jgi:uncharacterized protein (TIGR02328 family)